MKPPRPYEGHPGPWKVLIRCPGYRGWCRVIGSPFGRASEAMEAERAALERGLEVMREPL